MKKLIALIFAALIGCSSAKAVFLEYAEIFMTLYVPDCMGMSSSIGVDLYFCNTAPDDIEPGLFIKTHAQFAHNAEGLSYFMYYTIPPGDLLIFKLDNGEILTLKCEFQIQEKNDRLITRNGVYDTYHDYCYFRLNNDIIDKLLAHNIVKARAQFKDDTLDCSLVISDIHALPRTKEAFSEAIDTVIEESTAGIEEYNRQKALRENPLLDF